MNMFRKPHIRSITFLVFTVFTLPLATLHAQNRNSEAPEKRVHFRVMGMDSIIRNVAYVQDQTPVTFSASHSHPTEWMEYRRPGPLNFYRARDLENIEDIQNPEDVPPPVAQFVPPGSGQWLLLFVGATAGNTTGRFHVVPIPEDNDAVTEGIRLYNLTREPLGISVNDETLILNAGNRKQINPEPGPNNAMGMKIAAQGESGWEVISSTVFGHRPNARITYYIVRIDNRVRFKRFVDSVPQAVDPS